MKFPHLLSSTFLLIWAVFFSCNSGGDLPFFRYFNPAAITDTVYVNLDEASVGSVQPIPFSDFSGAVDASVLKSFVYPPDSSESRLFGHWQAPIDDHYHAYLLEIQQSWFKFKYLLVYSKGQQEFTSLVPVAYFYGGDGGQIRTESRLFGWENGRSPTLLVRSSEHALRMTDDDVQDVYHESVTRLEWRSGRFQEVSVQDSSRWVRAYPIKW